MALASCVTAEVRIEVVAEDELVAGLGVGDEDAKVALSGAVDVTTLSSAFGTGSTLPSVFFPVLKALGLSLAILERSSVWVPLTALETVSSVFLTRDMC